MLNVYLSHWRKMNHQKCELFKCGHPTEVDSIANPNYDFHKVLLEIFLETNFLARRSVNGFRSHGLHGTRASSVKFVGLKGVKVYKVPKGNWDT